MTKEQLVIGLLAGAFASFTPLRAENLFSDFLVPGFATDYSAWDVMYSPYNGANYPDFAAPFGTYRTATAAGMTAPANSNPANPLAFWDTRNPTITQTGTSTAFIVTPGAAGNIYSFAAPLSYQLAETTSYSLGTVVFQFQTDGALIDFSNIRLQYTDGGGHLVSLSANEMLREYRPSGSSFGGLMNRTALQWDLTGRSITSYQILWNSVSASSSFQVASLDTASTFGSVIPASRSWNAASGNWSDGSKWLEGSSSNETGNVNFVNASTGALTLNGNHTVAQATFNTAANTTINSPGNFTLTANTGVTTTALATGSYTINSKYQLGAYNLFDINAGTVTLAGVVSGSYGIEKNGNGTLVLSNNNTFTDLVGVNAGTLRLEGTNAYTASTTVLFGNLIVAANAPSGAAGALGNATTNVIVGADSAIFSVVGGGSAQLLIDGNFTVGRNITLADGTYSKTLGAQNAATGATYSGAVSFGTASNVHLKAASATDKVTFSGGMSGGDAAGAVAIDGLGAVSYAGAGKTYAYANAANVISGTLRVENGASLTSNGNVTVSGGATLIVHGSLNGSGALAINSGTVGGNGAIRRPFTIDTGDVLSPGASVGMLNTDGETWAGGGTLKLEINDVDAGIGIGWDNVNIAGALSLSATSGNKFTLQFQSLTLGNAPGLIADFNKNTTYHWRFLTTTTALSGFDASAFAIDPSGIQNTLSGTFGISMTSDSKGLQLDYLAVPEPSSGLLALCGAALFFPRRRRP